jgi:hypothetical protein
MHSQSIGQAQAPEATGPAELLAARAANSPGQLATRTLATSAMTSPDSDAGCAWTSPEICPPHSISIWP